MEIIFLSYPKKLAIPILPLQKITSLINNPKINKSAIIKV